MKNVEVYFSDFFDIDPKVIEEYGAVNISLINDIPLFIDPFLLFNSTEPQFEQIHKEMIDYLIFLKEQSHVNPQLSRGMMESLFLFPEVKQTWLGFSENGNEGRGLGPKFAKNLHNALSTYFSSFGEETIPGSMLK